MKDHGLWMAIGCILPMLLIFILPAFGFSSQTVFAIGIISMLACHLLMAGHHRGADGQDENRRH